MKFEATLEHIQKGEINIALGEGITFFLGAKQGIIG